jgi:hypothetical protein
MRKTLRLSAGFGHSDWADPKRFDYTFDHIASVIDDFRQAVGLSHYTTLMLVLARQTGAHITARRAGASRVSLDTVLISPSIAVA